MSVGVLLDVAVAGLLVATIVYAIVLNRRIVGLQKGREELAALIGQFEKSTEAARKGTEALRDLSEASATRLKILMDDAQALRDDLGFLIERGGAIADRIERDVRKDGQGLAVGPAGGSQRRELPESEDRGVSAEAIRDLRRILEAGRARHGNQS